MKRPKKRVLYTLEFDAMSNENSVNVVATLNDIAVGKPFSESYDTLPAKRKLLVFLNPFSNAGRGNRVWRSARQILEKAYINIVFIETERAGHAYNFMNTEDLSEYDGVVSVSGDGLLHEIVNGLMNRKDHYYFKRKIPIGIIPGGTSDGLAKALLDKSEEAYGLEQSLLLIIKGQTRLMDVTKLVLAGRPEPVYSFLSLTWGLIADVDLESEKIRCIGNSRYTIWGLLRILKLRRYHAMFSYSGDEIVNKNEVRVEPTMDYTLATNIKQKIFHEEEKEEVMRKSPSSNGHLKLNSEQSNVDLIDDIDLLTKIPSSWKTIKTHFSYFTLNNTPFIDKNVKNAPLSRINDGYNDLVIQYGRISC